MVFNFPATTSSYLYAVGISDPGMDKYDAVKLAIFRAKALLAVFHKSIYSTVRDFYTNEYLRDQFIYSRPLFREYGEINARLYITGSQFHLLDTHFTKYKEAIVLARYPAHINGAGKVCKSELIEVSGEIFSGNFNIDNSYEFQELYKFNCVMSIPLIFYHCGGTKKMTSAIEIEIPLSGKDYQSSETHFRAVQSGRSSNLATAKKIALQNAKTQLVGNIQSTIKAVTEEYVNQRDIGNQSEFEQKFEQLSRSVVNQKLSNINIKGQRVFQENDGNYVYWVGIEASKDAILNGINSAISEEDKIQSVMPLFSLLPR